MDVVITTTCRKTIEKCIPSFLNNVKYTGQFRFLVNIDVKNPRYLPKLLNFFRKMNIDNVRINHNPKGKPMGLTESVNYLYSKIQSKYYFNLEDDWIFLKEVDFDPLINLMEKNNKIDHIRLSKEPIKKYSRLYHLTEEDNPKFREPHINMNFDGIKLVRTFTWCFSPSLAKTSTLKTMLPVPSHLRAETYLCKKYDEMFFTRGAFILGQINDGALIKDIGRNKLREFFKKKKKRYLQLFK